MIYEDIVKKAAQAAKKINKNAIEEHLAVEFDIEGEGEGAFYVELDKGKADVQPYEYYDCDCSIRGGADVIMDLIAGKLDATVAYLQGKFRVEGDFDKAIAFAKAVKNVVAPKAPQKKAAAKKSPAKSAAGKTAKKSPAKSAAGKAAKK
ncbi:MAG: SCP2 sterol-binding domain-containing protein [Lachnospiraceae bacterium]|nr:SCP2 sterol-binding domain-containing protein [Lachnospiraceae bacterium]